MLPAALSNPCGERSGRQSKVVATQSGEIDPTGVSHAEHVSCCRSGIAYIGQAEIGPQSW